VCVCEEREQREMEIEKVSVCERDRRKIERRKIERERMS